MALKRIYAKDLASLVGKQITAINHKDGTTKQVWVTESDGSHVQTKFNHSWISFSCTDDTDMEYYTDVFEPDLPVYLSEEIPAPLRQYPLTPDDMEQTPGQIIDQALNSEEPAE